MEAAKTHAPWALAALAKAEMLLADADPARADAVLTRLRGLADAAPFRHLPAPEVAADEAGVRLSFRFEARTLGVAVGHHAEPSFEHADGSGLVENPAAFRRLVQWVILGRAAAAPATPPAAAPAE